MVRPSLSFDASRPDPSVPETVAPNGYPDTRRAQRRRQLVTRTARCGISHDAPVPATRRQGDPAQAPEQDLLPDLRRGARGDSVRGRPGAQAVVRLVLSVLSRSRALPAPGHDTERDAVRSGGCGDRSELRRPTDAEP